MQVPGLPLSSSSKKIKKIHPDKKFFYFSKWNFLTTNTPAPPKKNLIKLFYSPNLLAQKNVIKLFYTLDKTPLGETGYLSNLYYLLAAQASSFLIHPDIPNTVSQDTFGTLPLTVQYLCDLRDAMSRHWSPSTFHPTLPIEAEDFPRGAKYPKDVPLPTFLVFLQPV